MPIPPKQKEERKQPGLASWQSFVFLGLVATAATGMLISKGGFRMNRNLNVMQRFVSSHSDKIGKMVDHTPSGKDTIFSRNVQNIVETAQKIAEDKLPDNPKEHNARHAYPKPTFPSQQTSVPKKRTLLSSKPKDDNTNKDE